MIDLSRLSIYLNDHLAGSMIGVELAKRTLRNNSDTSYSAALSKLVTDIEADRHTLQDLMAELGLKRNAVKEAAAWSAEKAGRLKLNGKIFGYSELSRVLELEGLAIGVEGKLSLWRALKDVQTQHVALQSTDLDTLIRRAEDQRASIEELRLKATREAFVEGDGTPPVKVSDV
jgi:hypothetical protein